MVFDLRNFSSIAGNSTRGRSPVIHGYHTDDDKNTVITTPNYFGKIIQDLSVGDFIFVDSSVSSQFVLNVSSKGLNGTIEVEDSTIGSSGGLLVDESNPTLSNPLDLAGNPITDTVGDVTINSAKTQLNGDDFELLTSTGDATITAKSTNTGSNSDGILEADRGASQGAAAVYLSRLGNTEWVAGVYSRTGISQDDYTISRSPFIDPSLRIERNTGFIRVGDGAIEPETSLHVYRPTGSVETLTDAPAGNATNTIRSATTNAFLNLRRGTTAASCAMRFQQGAATYWQIGLDASPSTLWEDFTIRRGAGFTPDMQMDRNNGWTKFGQNIASPAAPFHVWQQTSDCVVLAEGAGSADAIFRAQSGTGNALIDIRRGLGTRDALVTYRTGATLEWAVGMDSSPPTFRPDYVIKTTLNGNPEFVFTTSGRLGIGTDGTEPSTKLHVSDAASVSSLLEARGGNATYTIDASDSASQIIDRGSVTDECKTTYSTAGGIDFIIGIENTLNRNEDFAFKRTSGATPDGYIDHNNGGLVWGSATGGSQGIGTINAVGVYDDSVLLTCYVLEQLVDGDVDLDKWNAIGTVDESGESKHIPANRFKETLTPYMDIEEYTKFFKANKHLPSFPSFEEYSKMSTGDLAQRLWETVEFQAVHNAQLLDRVKEMETKMQNFENKLSNLGV